jgi:predicted O-methyltransferase YrrM
MERLNEIKYKAIMNNVPIMHDAGILFCQDFIRSHNVIHILEIGTAVGYWSIAMAMLNPEIRIKTVEFSHARYLEAKANVSHFNLDAQIECIWMDAKDYETDQKFDLIFLDGPKAQQLNYFNRFINNLSSHGTILVDNVDFHGHVANRSQLVLRKNLRHMVEKIAYFQSSVENNPNYITHKYDVGDGILMIWRKYPESIDCDMITKGDSI